VYEPEWVTLIVPDGRYPHTLFSFVTEGRPT